jgi:hypothetical protein
MNPKSNILLQIEVLECVQRLKEYTEYLFESFRIDDIVLGIVNRQPQELTTGYMSESKEYETLDKALEGFNPSRNCLRIYEGKYFTGVWTEHPLVSEGENKVLRISDFKEL